MSFRLPPARLRPWTRAASQREADYRIFRVDRIQLVDGAGQPRQSAFVLDCPNWCNVVPVTASNEVVMIWQPRFGTDALSLEIPGGVIDPGEQPLAAAHRELREETGYSAPSMRELGWSFPNPAIQGNRCFTFVAEGVTKTHDTSFDDLEECETVHVPAREIAALIDEGTIAHALVVIALERWLRTRAASGGAA